MTEARRQIGIRLSAEDVGAVVNAADMAGAGPGPTAAVRRLLACGMRFVMQTYSNTPLSTRLLLYEDDEGIFRLYRKWIDAVSAEGDLDGRYKFEPVPDDEEGGYWIVDYDERMTSRDMAARMPNPPELDEFWRDNRRTFSEDGSIIFVPTLARLRREAREAREQREEKKE